MGEKKYNKVLTTILIIGIVLVFAVLGFWGFEIYKKYYTKKDANDAVEEFDSRLNTIADTSNLLTNVTLNVNGLDENAIETGNGKIARMTYKGFTMVGTIEIPKINLKYPVLDRASKASMEKSVGISFGPGLNKVGNTVIMGHNYRNGTFFSDLYKLANNDEIYITDESGTRIKYLVYNIYETGAEDFDYASRDTAGKREISLSTCTDDVNGRIIIWAKEAE